MIVRVRRARVPSVFAVALVLYGAVGLIVGATVAVVSTLPVPEGYEINLLDRLGLWSLLVFPLVYGLIGGLFAAVAAVLYNLAAAVTGGIRVDLRGLAALETEESAGSPGEGEGEAPERDTEAEATAGESPDQVSEPAGDRTG